MGISVIIPVYNQEKFVLDTLRSLDDQGIEPMQVIVVDDCSTDSSARIIRQWAAASSLSVQVIVHEQNRGEVPTVNDGFRLATQEFITVLDGDDILLPGILRRHCDILSSAEDDVAVVYGNSQFVSEDAQTNLRLHIADYEPFEGDILIPLIERGSVLPQLGATLRRAAVESVGGFDESYYYWDWFMWLALGRQWKFKYSHEVAGLYRKHPASMINTQGLRLQGERLRQLGVLAADPSSPAVERAAVERARRIVQELRAARTGWAGARLGYTFLRSKADRRVFTTSTAMLLRLPRRPLWRLVRALTGRRGTH